MSASRELLFLDDQYYIHASSSRVDDRKRVLKRGDTFAVFDRHGDIHPFGHGGHGLYCRDTRFLSRFELTIAGQRPLLLNSGITQDTAVFAGREPFGFPKKIAYIVTQEHGGKEDDGYGGFGIPMTPGYSATILAWVEAGGVLIGEAYFGGWEVEQGRHHTTLPGYGLHEVFGVRQKNAEPANEHGYAVVQGVTRAGEQAVRSGVNESGVGGGFVSSQPVDPSGGLGQVEITATEDLPFFPRGRKAYGALVKETFFVEGADVLATYADGEAAVTRNAYGDGQAILIGSYVGLLHQRKDVTANADLLAGLVEHAVSLERPSTVGDGRVRVDVLEHGDDAMVIVRNLESRPVTASVTVPGLRAGAWTEVFSGDALEATAAGDGASLVVTLGPDEVQVYRA